MRGYISAHLALQTDQSIRWSAIYPYLRSLDFADAKMHAHLLAQPRHVGAAFVS